jgi:hypothetical protein
MVDILSLQLPYREWTYTEWVDYIIENKQKVFSSRKDMMLKVYYVHTNDVALRKLLSDPSVKRLGDFKIITMSYQESSTKTKKLTEYWMHEKEPGLLMFFTASTKEGYEKTLQEKIGRIAGLYEMWIKPNTFKKITRHLINDKDCGIMKFLADRTRYDDTPQQVTENAERHMQYRTDNPFDGVNRLREIEYQLGMTAHSIDFASEGNRIQITDDGLFHLKTVTEESFNLMNDVLEEIKGEERSMRETAQSLKFLPRIPVEQENSDILESGKIILERELDAEIAKQITKQFKRFTFLDIKIMAGSLVFYSDVIDKQKGSIFSISVADSSILLIPKYRTTFETFLKFYKSIVELIDENAKLEKFSELVEYSR